MRTPLRIRSSDPTFRDLCEAIALRLGERGRLFLPLAPTPKGDRRAAPPPREALVELADEASLGELREALRLHLAAHPGAVELEAEGRTEVGGGVLPDAAALRKSLWPSRGGPGDPEPSRGDPGRPQGGDR